MARFDRYLLSQLLTLFGFFALVLVLVYWINRAVSLFDQLIADGQSAWVFLELTALTLPGVMRIVLPIAALVASIYATNRLASDSELVVVQATGYSPYRLARGALAFGLIASAMTLALTHVLVPLSLDRYSDRQDEIRQNVTSRLLVEGRFLTPTENVTIYIRDITREGELRDLFLSDSRRQTESLTYTAARAFLVKTDTGPQLVMIDGMAQSLDRTTGHLTTTRFEDFAYDVAGLTGTVQSQDRSISLVPSTELLRPTAELLAETGQTPEQVRLELHSRTAQALLALAGSLIGFAALVTGGFSRFGVWRQILVAISLVIVVKIIETIAINQVRLMPAAWWLPYAPIVVGLLMGLGLLWLADHPHLLRRRIKTGAVV